VIEKVHRVWVTWILSTQIYIWEKNIKLVKYALKDWEKTLYFSPTTEKEKILSKLEDVQRLVDKEEVTT
jgi:hypothetical protein